MSYQISHLLCSLALLLMHPNAYADFEDIQRIYQQEPSIDTFEICHGNGCAKRSKTAFTNEDWRSVANIFSIPAANAHQEREQLAIAIGSMEQITGAKIGTHADLAGTFNRKPGQMDCNDEAINTTTYLRLLKQHGYLRFHQIEDLTRRNLFFNGWPHTTAVIREVETGVAYAVDSWFYDNGHPATIVPLKVWADGYRPADSPIGQSR